MQTIPSESEVTRVKERWGSPEGAGWRTSKCVHWTQHPKVQERIHFLVSGDHHKDRFQYFIENYYRKGARPDRQVKRVLNLGCGHGEFDRGLSQYRFAKIHEGIDIADEAIADAYRLAKAEALEHLRYRVADINTIQLAKCAYDVVFGIGSIHHVLNLEHLFEQVAMSLKPGGHFFLDEYIGPSKFQWTESQLAIINDQIAQLPHDLKRSLIDGNLKGTIGRITIEEMDRVDPSEAVRSADILKVLEWYFDIVEIKGFGGSLLHMLLEGIAGNFTDDDPGTMQYLQSLFDLEDQLIADGKLQHDFAVIIARRKPTRVQKVLGAKIAYVVSKTRAMCENPSLVVDALFRRNGTVNFAPPPQD